jgi:NOT2 / NOT3 / NOT5 family
VRSHTYKGPTVAYQARFLSQNHDDADLRFFSLACFYSLFWLVILELPFLQKHPAATPSSYPQTQSPTVSNPALWERLAYDSLGTDTLFFAFYYQQVFSVCHSLSIISAIEGFSTAVEDQGLTVLRCVVVLMCF